MSGLTKKGAREVTRTMERLANVLEQESSLLGIPAHIAADAARRLDLLSDAIERNAGLDPMDMQMKQAMDREADFDAASIGKKVSGPLETVDTPEPFMSGEFTQQENSELRGKQEAGQLSDGVADVKTAFKKLMAALKDADLNGEKAATVKKALRLATTVVEAAKKAEDDEEDEEVEAADDEDEKKGSKKASHGFNLSK